MKRGDRQSAFRKLLPAITACLVLVAGGCGEDRSGYAPAPLQTLRIASSLPHKGLQAAQTRLIEQAILLAVEEHPRPLPGWTATQLTLDDSEEESGSWSQRAEERNAALAAADPSVIAYIGPYTSDATAVSLPVTNRARLLQMAPVATWPGLTLPGWDPGEPDKYYPTAVRTFVRLMPDDSQQGVAAAIWAHDLGAKRVYALTDGSSYSNGLASAFSRSAAAHGVVVAGERRIDDASLAQVLSVSRSDAIFYAPSSVRRALDAVDALQNVRLRAGVFVSDTAMSDQFAEEAGDRAAGWHFVFNGSQDLPAASAAFSAKFKARYGQEPTQFAANAYVLATTALEAVSATGSTDRATIADWVLRGDRSRYPTVPAFTSSGDVLRWQMTGYRLVGGAFQVDRTIHGAREGAAH